VHDRKNYKNPILMSLHSKSCVHALGIIFIQVKRVMMSTTSLSKLFFDFFKHACQCLVVVKVICRSHYKKLRSNIWEIPSRINQMSTSHAISSSTVKNKEEAKLEQRQIGL